MPTRLRHRHRLGHGPCNIRPRALGPTRGIALSLGACGPAHEGQLDVEPTGVSIKTGTWSRQDNTLRQPAMTPTEIGQACDLDTGECPTTTFYDADPSVDSERKRGGDNTVSPIKVRQTTSNHTSLVVTSGPTLVEAMPDKLASINTWH